MKNPAAVELGRLGGLKGGAARAKALSSKRRNEISRKAVYTRWKNHPNNKNDSIRFHLDNHDELTKIITEYLLKNENIDFSKLKEKKRIEKSSNGFWMEEYMATLCWVLFHNLPIKDRIEWLSEFLGRTEIQIHQLLGLHVWLSQPDNHKIEDDYEGYTDLWIWMNSEISTYFEKYYKRDFLFKYKK